MNENARSLPEPTDRPPMLVGTPGSATHALSLFRARPNLYGDGAVTNVETYQLAKTEHREAARNHQQQVEQHLNACTPGVVNTHRAALLTGSRLTILRTVLFSGAAVILLASQWGHLTTGQTALLTVLAVLVSGFLTLRMRTARTQKALDTLKEWSNTEADQHLERAT